MFSADEYYSEEKQCTYKNETYLVRNNGAVLRCPKNANKIRPLDNKWTFGNLGDKGYLYNLMLYIDDRFPTSRQKRKEVKLPTEKG
ncbi:MAG: hypothetical protein SOU80_02660 [Alphaproteobacteria bacterium]|nr:hypothetical protein [Alphaproteobacteria bacterium]